MGLVKPLKLLAMATGGALNQQVVSVEGKSQGPRRCIS